MQFSVEFGFALPARTDKVFPNNLNLNFKLIRQELIFYQLWHNGQGKSEVKEDYYVDDEEDGSNSLSRGYTDKYPVCCIFRPAFGCCALQTLVKIVIFSIFSAKKLKKQDICSNFFCKKHAGRMFQPPKNELFLLKCFFAAKMLKIKL